jgi:nucleotide-binding universal stress UspA family protein
VIVRRILVPLDGSRLAEAALPAAASVAQRLGAQVLLLHVLERDAPENVHGEPHLTGAAAAHEYLDAHAMSLRDQGVEAQAHVHERPVTDVASALDGHAHEFGVDLIVMCAHGRTNPLDRALGTIAERILRGGSSPILLRTVRHPQDAAFDVRNLLVAIDFGHDVELALDAARTFAAPYRAPITLLTAPEPASSTARLLLPSASALAGEFDEADAGPRLGAYADGLRAGGFEAAALVGKGEPSSAIVSAARSLAWPLVAVVTDAHGGLASWYAPSTLQRLLGTPDLALLLIKEP